MSVSGRVRARQGRYARAMSSEAQSTEAGPAAIDPQVVAAFEDAQTRAQALLAEGRESLESGMSEKDIVSWFMDRAEAHGFTGWFDRPYVRINSPAVFRYEESSSRRLEDVSMVEVLLQPATDSAFACAGATWMTGDQPDAAVVDSARELCRGAVGYAGRFKCTGEVYVFADAWTRNRGLTIEMEEQQAIGHLCLPPQGLLSTGWPNSARLASYLRRNQLGWFNYRRMHGIYAIRPRIFQDDYSALFAEMVVIDGETKRILGRNDVSEVGRFWGWSRVRCLAPPGPLGSTLCFRPSAPDRPGVPMHRVSCPNSSALPPVAPVSSSCSLSNGLSGLNGHGSHANQDTGISPERQPLRRSGP